MYLADFSAFAAWWLASDEARALFAGAALLAVVLPALLSFWDWRRY